MFVRDKIKIEYLVILDYYLFVIEDVMIVEGTLSPGHQEGEGRSGERMPLKEPDRGSWSHPCDFFISTLGYAVGLGEMIFSTLIYNLF